MADVRFRKTNADDYDEVTAVREHLYDGLDYLADMYHHFLETETGFAGYINNIMVCFVFAAAIDDNTRVSVRAARVRKGYEGLGIYKQMRQYCMMNLPTKANKMLLTVSPKISEKLLQGPANLILKRNVLEYTTTNTSLKPLLVSKQNSTLPMHVDKSYFQDVILSHNSKRHLFPENKIVVFSVPYELMSANVERIFLQTDILASCSDAKQWEFDNRIYPKMISACTSHQCEFGTMIYIDLFGFIGDEKMTSDHIYAHLLRCLDSSKENIALYLTYQLIEDNETLQRILSELGGKKTCEQAFHCIETYVVQ